MADWKDQYLAALAARDEIEKANSEIYDAYAKLADRAALVSQTPSQPNPTDLPQSPPPVPITSRRASKLPAAAPTPDPPSIAQLRTDFLTTQIARATLESELASTQTSLTNLQSTQQKSQKRITQLTTQLQTLATRLRDRDEELKGKAKLLEDVQDENATLNLELNAADEQAKKLKQENKELVDRWMERMGKEAEKMNEEGKFG